MIVDETGTRELTENETEIISDLLHTVEDFYPEAYRALREAYAASSMRPSYYNYLMARRFVKCNFGRFDNEVDMTDSTSFKFEFVDCPLRGECKHDQLICNPKFNSELSQRELDVMQCFYDGQNESQISDKLFISINTVQAHKKNVFKKLKIHRISDFVKYANDHKLYK